MSDAQERGAAIFVAIVLLALALCWIISIQTEVCYDEFSRKIECARPQEDYTYNNMGQ